MRGKNQHLSYFERNGLFSVIGLVLLFLLVRAGQRQNEFKLSPGHIRRADSLANFMVSSNKKANIKSEENRSLQLVPFNPNTVHEKDLREMGIRPSLVSNLLAYRNKVGDFQSVKDLKKLYNLQSGEYEMLRPYILLPDKKTTRPFQTTKKQDEENPMELKLDFPYMDLNSCDTAELKEIKGIGSYYAKRIIRFRDALGGFHHLDQLKETYNLPDSVYQKIKPHFYLSENGVHVIEVNSVNEEQLRKHPYIDYQEARAIVRYRAQHGTFRSIGDLKKVYLLKNKNMEKLAPYLSFE